MPAKQPDDQHAKHPMFYIGFCRICGTGPLGLRCCGGCDGVVVLCDECDAMWTNSDLEASPILASDGDLPCPTCHASLINAPSKWADEAQIEASPWLQDALEAGAFRLRRGSAFAPEVGDGDEDQSQDEP